MTRILSLFVMFMLFGVLAFAQNRVVTGTVIDDKGQPVAGASVRVVGTNAGTSTDAEGRFTLPNVAPNATLRVTGAGIPQRDMVASGSIANFTVTRTEAELTTVVVTALGVQRQAQELGYSTAKISTKDLNKAQVVNIQNGLTGKVSGLTIQSVNSGVFGDTRINLRGIRSLTGNNSPMLIVDGVPIALSYLSSINPNDVQDVTVLKSSSSTAVYGPDGVNGAIVVTTKKGLKGGRTAVTVGHTIQWEKVSFMPKFQTKFGSGSAVDANGYGVYDPIENQTYGDPFDGSLRNIGREDELGAFKRATYEARPAEKFNFWDVGVTNQTDVSLTSGDFYLSAQKVGIKGISPGDENDRISLAMSSAKEFGKLKATFTARYTQGVYDVNAGAQFGNGRDYVPYWNLVNTPINIPVTEFKNWRTDKFSNPNYYFNDYYHNPYWIADMARQKGRSDDLLGSVELNYKLLSWLNLTYRIGGTVTGNQSKSTLEAFTFSDFARSHGKSNAQSDINAGVRDQSLTSRRINSEIFGTMRKEFGKLDASLLLGQSFRETNTSNINVSSTNLGIPEVFNVSVRKGEPGASEGTSKTRLQRYFGKLGLGYNKWLFAEVTGSYDTDSRLYNTYAANPKISFFYPGASMSLILTNAIPSLKNDFLSFAKIRGAISKTGNVNLGPYNLENTYSQGIGFPYGSLLGFTSNNVLRRSSYEPEFVKEKEVGLELGFLNNRINFEMSAYQQDNENQIITVDYSAATGFPNALLNAADFTNKGLEFDLKLTPLVKIGAVSVDVKGNLTIQKNKVNKLIDGVDELSIGNGNYIINGQPAYTFKLTDYIRDPQGRVVVDSASGYPTVDPNLKQFGQTLPKYILGLSTNIGWKGFNLSAVADFRGGNQVLHDIGGDMDFSGISYRSAQYGRLPFIFPNSSIETAPGKFVENTSTYVKSGGYDFWSQARNTGVDANYLTSANFWKLREVALSYTLPSQLFTGKGIKGASFSVSGRNLLTWLPKTNQWTDPEFSNTTGNAQGVNDINNTPPTRIMGVNVTLTF